MRSFLSKSGFAFHLALLGVAVCLSSNSAHAASQTWSGGSTADGNWNTGGNWGGSAPGAVSGTTNTDTATFKNAIANTWGNSSSNPVVVDSSSQNIGSISFSANAGNYFIGSTGGNSIYLTAGGTILASVLTNASVVTETINAPLVMAGAYVIKNSSTSGSGTNSGILNIGGAISSISGATNTTLALQGTNTNLNTIGGNITNGTAPTTVRITKSEAGTWVLSGTNSYTGATAVTVGTLLINGSNSAATGAISVSSGAILGGVGTVGSIITSAGALSPGDGTTAIGTLHGTGLTLNTGADFKFDLGSSNSSDRIALTGAFTKGTGTSFNFNFNNTGVTNSTYTLATFNSLAGGLTAGNFTYSGLTSGVTGTFGLTGSNLTFTTVPEPATWALLAFSLTTVMVLRRRRKD
jgi:hypothetical protein